MKANSDKSKQSKKATRRVLAGVLCGASVLSLVLSLVMPPISQAIANDAQTVSTEETVMGGGSSSESTDVDNTNNGDTENQNSDETESGELGDDALRTAPPSDDTGAESAAQPADDGADNENAIALASVNANDNTGLQGNVTGKFKNGGSYCLTSDAWSTEPIDIQKDTKINLAGHKLYYRSPKNETDTFITVKSGALTIEDYIEDSGKSPVETTITTVNDKKPGQFAEMKWTSDNNGTTPQSLTYYETTSTPNTDGLGTTETTKQHTVSGFGAIVAASGSGSVKQVISVADGGTLNLNGGMITTPRDLAGDGHIILAVGQSNETQVNINGGFITGANLNQQRGGWGGGLCVVGAKVTVNMTGGVIAANKAASGGGIYAADAKLNLSGGVISGNATYSDSVGLGGGILVSGGSVTVSDGYITNNKYAKFCGEDGQGGHGGAGLAANNGAHVAISGGQITGNYSDEAGGGVYVTNFGQQSRAWLDITGGNIASNVSYKSEGAGIRVGQKVDAMISGASKDSPVYITNNHCMSRFDWGGGGVFVQGDSDNDASNAGRLFVYNSYISSNTAGGYGGGVAVCPTGKTLVTNTKGTAIFGNTDAQNADSYDENDNDNNGKPHLSGGGHKKTQDKDAYYSADENGDHVFRDSGHADFFLAAEGHITPVAVVTGKMLGDIDAKYSGSIELTDRITIPANGVAQVKNSIGLTSDVKTADKTTIEKATTFITGNYSWNHGGGIMSNGNLYLGEPADTYVYPSLKLKATKALSGRKINNGEFFFTVYRKDKVDPFANGVFNHDVCTPVGTASNVDGGNITFNLGEQSSANGTAGTITYYLVENAGKVSGITYDPAVYEIKVTVEDHSTVLMTVSTRDDPNKTIELKIHNYKIKDVSAVEHPKGETDSQNVSVQPDATEGYYSIVGPDGGKTFTNTYDPKKGSWTPKATKVVKGGEMKKFTLQLATDSHFEDKDIIGTAETSGPKKTQKLSFRGASNKETELKLEYSLSDIRTNPYDPGDSTGRGPSKTFTYYVREQQPTTQFTNYKYDQSIYQITVTAADDSNGKINISATYKQIQDRDGKLVANGAEHTFSETDTPTFTNTYSTSLPLSGMSGVTLTYLAGAAVLCAAAAWMHIRRKANAKGGKRRE